MQWCCWLRCLIRIFAAFILLANSTFHIEIPKVEVPSCELKKHPRFSGHSLLKQYLILNNVEQYRTCSYSLHVDRIQNPINNSNNNNNNSNSYIELYQYIKKTKNNPCPKILKLLRDTTMLPSPKKVWLVSLTEHQNDRFGLSLEGWRWQLPWTTHSLGPSWNLLWQKKSAVDEYEHLFPKKWPNMILINLSSKHHFSNMSCALSFFKQRNISFHYGRSIKTKKPPHGQCVEPGDKPKSLVKAQGVGMIWQ